MHKVEMIGYLALDPQGQELDNNFICNFRVLADNPGNEDPIGFYIAVQGDLGKACQKFLAKGRHVFVEGHLRYNPESGNPRTFTGSSDLSTGSVFEIDANIVEFLN